MSKWSAIVYGRTHAVDYRFLALPKSFREEDKKWLKGYILATTRFPEQLQKNQIWSIIKNESYCIMGITCMVKDLIDKSKYESDITLDKAGRNTLTFVGYVCMLSSEKNQELKSIPDLYKRAEIFAELTKYIDSKWNIKDHDLAGTEPEYLDDSISIDCPHISTTVGEGMLIKILDSNSSILSKNSHDSIEIFPNNEDWRRGLWEAIAKYILLSQHGNSFSNRDISLCLGAKKIEYILHIQNPFLLATVDGIEQRKIHDKIIVDKPDIRSKLYVLWKKWGKKIIGTSTGKLLFSMIYLVFLLMINNILSGMEIGEDVKSFVQFLTIAVLSVFYLILLFLIEGL